VRGFANAAADLQDVLGSLNDEAVTLRLLASIDAPDTQLSHGTGIIRGFLHARAHASLDRFETAWRRFSKTDPFW
jgi:CHAD domain-containing protein